MVAHEFLSQQNGAGRMNLESNSRKMLVRGNHKQRTVASLGPGGRKTHRINYALSVLKMDRDVVRSNCKQRTVASLGLIVQ